MKIIPCGTDVTITQAGAIGRISEVRIRFDSVTYEVTYYIDGVRQVVWPVHEKELQVQSGSKKIPIGYK